MKTANLVFFFKGYDVGEKDKSQSRKALKFGLERHLVNSNANNALPKTYIYLFAFIHYDASKRLSKDKRNS